MFVELHARSAFSFLEGASVPEELAIACSEVGLPAAALLDINGVYGAPRFYHAMKKFGLKAHIGAEIAVGSRQSPVASNEREQTDDRRLATGDCRLPLLCSSRLGYQNLC